MEDPLERLDRAYNTARVRRRVHESEQTLDNFVDGQLLGLARLAGLGLSCWLDRCLADLGLLDQSPQRVVDQSRLFFDVLLDRVVIVGQTRQNDVEDALEARADGSEIWLAQPS